MKPSGRLSILILIVVVLLAQAPPVSGVGAQGNTHEQAVTLQGVYGGWIEIDIHRTWDSPAPEAGLVENSFRFYYIRSQGQLDLVFVSGKPQRVKIDLSLPFYLIARQHIIPPGSTGGNPCQGFYTFANGNSKAAYDRGADGSSTTFKIRGFTFMPESKRPSVSGTGGNCSPGIPDALQAALVVSETEAMLPETFDWTFVTTDWTKDQTRIGGTCTSEGYQLMPGAAVLCSWSAFKMPKPTPLIVPPRKR